MVNQKITKYRVPAVIYHPQLQWQIIDLHDKVEIHDKTGEGIQIIHQNCKMENNQENPIWQLAEFLARYKTQPGGIQIQIKHHILLHAGAGKIDSQLFFLYKNLVQHWHLNLKESVKNQIESQFFPRQIYLQNSDLTPNPHLKLHFCPRLPLREYPPQFDFFHHFPELLLLKEKLCPSLTWLNGNHPVLVAENLQSN
ncbi:MAG TPA: hypothetical protein PLQ36_00145 [Candidatus Gracilibacteria bacterium]|nr:hypothetical protein [Candidatus Gracilibacteria bacterium]